MDKCYSGTIKLGEGTPSQDADTEADEVMAWEAGAYTRPLFSST
jgi:hypothetical protein